MHFVFEHAWHEPFGALFLHLVEGKQRYIDAQAVFGVARLVQVAGAAVYAAQAYGFGELVGGDACGVVPHEFILIDVQQLRSSFAGLGVPLFKLVGVADIGGDVGIVVGVNQFFIHQHVLAARFVLDFFDVLHHAAVGGQKGQLAFPLVAYEGLADKDFAGSGGVDAVKINAAVVVDD